MRKKKINTVCLIDDKGNTILERKVTSLPLREEVILAKSVEFFDDPEPCMIHRSAVMNRLFEEINHFLEESLPEGAGELSWKCVPDFLKGYIDIPDRVESIILR